MAMEGKRTQGDYTWLLNWGGSCCSRKMRDELQAGAEKFGIHGRSTVLVWLRRYGQQDWSPLALQLVRAQPDMTQPLTPEQRIKQLETELETSRQRTICAVAGFVAVLDCLEQLGILAFMGIR